MRYSRLTVICGALGVFAVPQLSRAANSAAIKVDPVVVTLIDQVEVSAREAAALSAINVKEGQLVQEGEELARQEDAQATLAYEKAQYDLEIAKKQAASDLKLRYAKKSADVAAVELQRGLESVQKFKNSVSQSEIDQLRLMKDRSDLELEQAKEDQQIAEITAKLKQNAVEVAADNVQRRHIVAPLAGMVVLVKHHKGEWVQPGDPIVRIVRLDHLRAEAFLNSRDTTTQLTGRPVTLTVDLPGAPHTQFQGKVQSVDPEINPVNGQFRVRAEIENRDQLLHPGLHGTMIIGAPDTAESP